MIFTTVPMSEVFPERADCAQDGAVYGQYNGKTVALRQSASGKYQMERLISTNAQDYLNEDFAPGAEIDGAKLSLS